ELTIAPWTATIQSAQLFGHYRDGSGCFRTGGAGIRTKAGTVRSDAGRCPISAQCRILGVAKSTCCWMIGHPETERIDPYDKDVERV
ncbi:hypothetical protein ACOI8V_06755, partial [Bifidobacterium hominis]